MTSGAPIRRTWLRAPLGAFLLIAFAAACGPSSTGSPLLSGAPSTGPTPVNPAASATPPTSERLVIVGRILTMDTPPVAEGVLIEQGLVTAIGDREEILARAGDRARVVDIGENVAYPGFIDAHAHWIGDRDYYGLGTPAEAMNAAITRGWTSISEQWIDPEKLDLLLGLAADDALSLRVDAYLALNFKKDFLGDWYTSRAPGPVGERLRVRGVKIHLDDGLNGSMNWEPADLTATIGRADAAGWQVSVHSARSPATGLALDAFQGALGLAGPNPLHHRIEHALQVTDQQLARMAALNLATVIHLDGAADWLLDDAYRADFERDRPGARVDWVARWRDFVEAGLHVASATDAPWTFPDFKLTADMGRPVDQIAAGMDGRTRTSPTTPSWLLDQLLTAEQGLRAVTLDAAWALGDETRRGHLASGTLGDVTILSGDVTAATADEIRQMKVIATIVGGIPAYCADAQLCSRLVQ